MTNSINKDYSISLIRLIATLMIVTCHIMQYYGNVLAWWFNVGVQIFLCMSGYLYGKKSGIDNDIAFYVKEFIKILIPYYVVIIVMLLVTYYFKIQTVDIITIFRCLTFSGTLPNGGGHLWFIPYILFCYLITPFLHRYFLYFDTNNKSRIVSFFTLIIIFALLEVTFLEYFNSAWIACYIIGFFYGLCIKNKYFFTKSLIILLVISCVVFNALQIYFQYVNTNNVITKSVVFGKYCNYCHALLGCTIFILLKKAFEKIKYSNLLIKILESSDKYSYYIYLVHQFFILGSLSLLKITNSVFINIIIVVICISISTYIVSIITTKILNISTKQKEVLND